MEIDLSLKMAIGTMLLLACGLGIALMQCGAALAKSMIANVVNAVVAGLFAVVGFLSLGAVLLFNVDLAAGDLTFDPLNLWGQTPDTESILLALWLCAFSAVFTMLPLGAVSGRLKWSGVAVFAFLNGGVILPVIGRWIWLDSIVSAPNQGWLEAMNFTDFAGFSLIGIGAGAAGLAIALAAGARQGKFSEINGRPFYLPAANPAFGVFGVGLVAIGWLGFVIGYPGASPISSTMVEKIFILFAITTSAAIASSLCYRLIFGALNAMIFTQAVMGGLVAGLACCSQITPLPALIVGGGAGILVVAGTIALEKIKIDDVSGVVPAHLFCGIWGVIAVAIFGEGKWDTQLIAAAAIGISVGAATFTLALALKKLGCFLISKEQEKPGLDFVQHGITTRSTQD